MEAKLREYRALRRRQQFIENAKEKIRESKEKLVKLITPKFFTEMSKEKEEEVLLMENEETHHQVIPPLVNPSDVTSELSEIETTVEENPESWKYFIVKWSIYLVVWLTLYAIFLKLQFGAVFFVISVLIGICLNTRTTPKKKGEISAYSVFNQNCVSIDGTLKAEQFEREIRYGAGSVR
ncbi:unnamed protein product [Diatraea saccharalis]|uniref:SAYSvFN domain-containing protein n=1 Tax=Diatraea saccharalis TaxID=40085 RepID=A0A9N9WF83_9NEOP|nr:unnamed protein product [Diatraea saccharalis]